MPGDTELGRELLQLAAIRDYVNRRYAALHDDMKGRFLASGVERQRWKLNEFVDLGTVSLVPGEVSAFISDHEAAMDWCEDVHPTELIVATKVTRSMREAFWRKIKTASEKAGIGTDPTSGEVLDWITFSVREPTIFVRSSDEAKGVVRNLATHGKLKLAIEK